VIRVICGDKKSSRPDGLVFVFAFGLCGVVSLWGARIQFTTPMLFALGFISVFVTGGLGGFFLGSAWTDIPLHNTYFVVGRYIGDRA
jgi:heme/copper-type cytochrome/quinol oxidase subunit 1